MSVSKGKLRAVMLVGGAIGASILVAGQGPPNHGRRAPNGGQRPQSATNLGDPLPGLAADELARFQAGKDAFEDEEDAADGLGPVFTGNSCVACHNAGATGGSGTHSETRIGRYVGGVYDPLAELGGPLIQDQGIGLFNGVNFVGEAVPAAATVTARRVTTALFGLGLVDAVPDDVLLMIAQQEMLRNRRTAGRPSIVVDPATGRQRVGRFGWKGQQATLFAFAGDAYVNEMGVTTPLFPDENSPQGNDALLAANPADNLPNDVDNSTLVRFTDFMAFLAPPPRGPGNPREVQAGQAIFAQIGCAECHLPSLQTGPSDTAALDQVVFSPYSDFLLHDMGSLGDGITQDTAGPREIRTAALWGLRFKPSLLHDGRAASVPAAIQAHDGQGRDASRRFTSLRPQDRANLVAFLNTL